MKLGLGHSLSGGVVPAAAAADTSFTFTINTENAGSATKTFVLPLVSDGVIDIDVDWGDSNTDTITLWNQAETTHVYSSTGTYTVKLEGTIRGFRFANGGDKLKFLDVSQWGDMNITFSNTFQGCRVMTCSATDVPTVSSTDMTATFHNCWALNDIGGDWDMSSVTNLYLFFYQNSVFNGASVANWDTSLVTNMWGTFYDCYDFNQPIGSWDTSSATTMGYMLRGSAGAFNQNISSWDIADVTDLGFFLVGQTLSTANYDALLIGWEAQSVTSGLSPNFGSSTYTGGGTAEAARTNLIESDGWTITDGGIA